jgi:hypothetical protein
LAMAGSLAELDELLGRLDPAVELPAGSEHLPRGHLQGPRAVTLPEGWMQTRDDPTPPTGADRAYCG